MKKGLRWTSERSDILKEVSLIRKHFDADELLIRLRQKKKRTSKDSIYRTLKLLVEANILRPVIFTDRHGHYERVEDLKHHEHLVCNKCGKIIEFQKDSLEKMIDVICRENRFKQLGHKTEITGLCKKCR